MTVHTFHFCEIVKWKRNYMFSPRIDFFWHIKVTFYHKVEYPVASFGNFKDIGISFLHTWSRNQVVELLNFSLSNHHTSQTPFWQYFNKLKYVPHNANGNGKSLPSAATRRPILSLKCSPGPLPVIVGWNWTAWPYKFSSLPPRLVSLPTWRFIVKQHFNIK